MKGVRVGTFLLATLLLVSCGSVIYTTWPKEKENSYDFSEAPSCTKESEELAPTEVGLRYLGAGGLHVEWREKALLFSPYFSNQALLRVPFGARKPHEDRIKAGLADLDREKVGSIIVGHAHYDHLGDIPEVATMIPGARIYTNTNGKNFLDPWMSTVSRVEDLSDTTKGWTQLKNSQGEDLPFKIYPIISSHADHVGPFCWRCENPKKPWPKNKKAALLNELWAGNDLSFVLDLLGPTDLTDAENPPTLFRIFYQDAASTTGLPEFFSATESSIPVDLAMLCLASSYKVPGHPRNLIMNLHPRHLLVTHYEDFFRDPKKPLRFVPFLTNKRASGFIREAERALADLGTQRTRPLNKVCGPASSGWSMPLPREELVFEAGRGKKRP